MMGANFNNAQNFLTLYYPCEQWEESDASSEALLDLEQVRGKLQSLEAELSNIMIDLTSVNASLGEKTRSQSHTSL